MSVGARERLSRRAYPISKMSLIHYDCKKKKREREMRLRNLTNRVGSNRVERARETARNHSGLVTETFIACSYNEINQSSFRAHSLPPLSLSLFRNTHLSAKPCEEKSLTKFPQRSDQRRERPRRTTVVSNKSLTLTIGIVIIVLRHAAKMKAVLYTLSIPLQTS